ncbi:MAG: hypothetical protein GQ576_07015 [Methanococcoides sp.]|nr:hypothetical protein [Methanococcoides sp.]
MNVKTIAIFFIALLFIMPSPALAAPSISSYSNTATNNNNLYPDVVNGATVTFSVTVDEAVTLYEWWDGSTQVTNNQDTFARSWTDPYFQNVTVKATTATGSVSMVWYPILYRAEAVTTAETIDETPYDTMMSSMEDQSDYISFLSATVLPFTGVIGSMFYVLVWGIYFGMVWIRQESIYVPSVVGLIVGMVLFVFLPSQFAVAGTSLLVLSAAAAIFNLYKER